VPIGLMGSASKTFRSLTLAMFDLRSLTEWLN
jgi:hypothetical protein